MQPAPTAGHRFTDTVFAVGATQFSRHAVHVRRRWSVCDQLSDPRHLHVRPARRGINRGPSRRTPPKPESPGPHGDQAGHHHAIFRKLRAPRGKRPVEADGENPGPSMWLEAMGMHREQGKRLALDSRSRAAWKTGRSSGRRTTTTRRRSGHSRVAAGAGGFAVNRGVDPRREVLDDSEGRNDRTDSDLRTGHLRQRTYAGAGTQRRVDDPSAALDTGAVTDCGTFDRDIVGDNAGNPSAERSTAILPKIGDRAQSGPTVLESTRERWPTTVSAPNVESETVEPRSTTTRSASTERSIAAPGQENDRRSSTHGRERPRRRQPPPNPARERHRAQRRPTGECARWDQNDQRPAVRYRGHATAYGPRAARHCSRA